MSLALSSILGSGLGSGFPSRFEKHLDKNVEIDSAIADRTAGCVLGASWLGAFSAVLKAFWIATRLGPFRKRLGTVLGLAWNVLGASRGRFLISREPLGTS